MMIEELLRNNLPYADELMKSLDYMNVKVVCNPDKTSPDLFFVLSFPHEGIRYLRNIIAKKTLKEEQSLIEGQVIFTPEINWALANNTSGYTEYMKLFSLLNIESKFATIGIHQKDNNPAEIMITLIHEYFHAADSYINSDAIRNLDLYNEILNDFRTLTVLPENHIKNFTSDYISLDENKINYLYSVFPERIKQYENLINLSDLLDTDKKLRNIFIESEKLIKLGGTNNSKIEKLKETALRLSEYENNNLLFYQ